MNDESNIKNPDSLTLSPAKTRRRSASDADIGYNNRTFLTTSFHSDSQIPILRSSNNYINSRIPAYLDIERNHEETKLKSKSSYQFTRGPKKTLSDKLKRDENSIIYKHNFHLNYNKIVREDKIWTVTPNPLYFDFELSSNDVIIVSNKSVNKCYRYLLLCGLKDKDSFLSNLPIELIKLIYCMAETRKRHFLPSNYEWWNHMWIGNVRYTRLDKFIISLFAKVRARTWYTSKVGKESELIRRPISALEAANNITRLIVLKEIEGNEIYTFDDNYNRTGDFSMLKPHVISALIQILNSNKD